MARLARAVVPGIPHLITQRGNRRQRVFFTDDDYVAYKAMLGTAAAEAGCAVWAYCLLPTHVHLILTPHDADGLRATLAEAHRRYTRRINMRKKWTGHLWQGRFGSVAMDEDYAVAAVRHVTLNPVRSRLVKRARDWKWSSARAHLAGKDDDLVEVAPVLDLVADFAALLKRKSDDDKARVQALRAAETIGRPLGDEAWFDRVEAELGRSLRPKKRGPKPKVKKTTRSAKSKSKSKK